MSDLQEPKVQCFFCRKQFNFGAHKYYGKYIKDYQISVCDSCLRGNWDGLNPMLESKFEEHLKANDNLFQKEILKAGIHSSKKDDFITNRFFCGTSSWVCQE